MESFRHMIERHSALKDIAEKKRDKKRAQNALDEGLNLTTDILQELEVERDLRGRDFESVESLLCSLKSYASCSLENGTRNLPYIAAELAITIVKKLADEIVESKENIIVHRVDQKDLDMCPCQYFDKKQVDELNKIIFLLRSANRFQVNYFVSSVVDLKLPVVFLRALQKADLVQISAYVVQIVNKRDALDYFISDLFSHLGKYENNEESTPMLCDAGVQLLAPLLQLGLAEDFAESGPKTWQLCNKACHDFVKQFLKKASEQMVSQEENGSYGRYFGQLCDRKWHVGERALQDFLCLSLVAVAVSAPIPAKEALTLQQQWLLAENFQSSRIYLFNLLSAMGQERALSGILSMINEESAKWQHILFFLSTFLTHFPEGITSVKAFVDECLERALTKQSRPLLSCVFLIARQACLMPNVTDTRNVFSSYGSWFGSAFGVEAGMVQTSTNPAAFSFLMDFLTDLVPTDPPLCLRVHINKVPAAPPLCSSLLADYVSLAKTRLHDLGEGTTSGLFAFENAPDDDVAAALSYFESSGGQISRVLLDSSKFRRMQFEQQFLTALLVAEPAREVCTLRQRLINKLQVAGKIPALMMQQYEMACQRLTSHCPGHQKRGVVLGSPLENWQTVLELLVDLIRNHNLNPKEMVDQCESMFSAVSTQLKTVLRWAQEHSDTATIHCKVVGKLFKACELCFTCPVPQRLNKWLCRMITLLKVQPLLLRRLQAAVYRIACNTTFSSAATEAAAAVACILDFNEEVSCSLKSPDGSEGEKLGEVIVATFEPVTKKKMLHALKFCSTYLHCLVETSAGLPVNKCFKPSLRLLIYLRERLLFSSDQEVLNTCSQSWTPPSSWAVLVSETQLCLTEWLELEALVKTTEDPVDIRHLYLCEWIMQHCDKNPAPDLFAASLKYTVKNHASWGNELLHVISSLPSSATSDQTDQINMVPWLLGSWKEMSVHFDHQDILKMVMILPRWMLLSNSFGVAPSAACISVLADLLDKHMQKMYVNGFLSAQVISLVIGAVRSAAFHCQNQVLSQIIDSSPSFHVGLLKHNKQLVSHLTPSFTASSASDCSLQRLMDVIENVAEPVSALSSCNWEVGLVRWSEGIHLPQIDDGSLFFHMLDLGSNIIMGSISIPMNSNGSGLPLAAKMATLLVQEPLVCLKMLKDSIKENPLKLPAAGISQHGLSGLSLASMVIILSLHEDNFPCSGSETSRICSQVLQQCLNYWKEVCQGLDPCVPQIQEVTFIQWLTRRIKYLIKQF